ncbi:MAG: acyl-CoA/acyl-ACP dehydrogenase [Deltaproteobacteria bacterium]|nr:acyl-CoA/acyl-ACP dehydrogenase [Deltaproteobacteria bacterium]
MNFDFSEDQKFVQRTAAEYLADHAPLSVCREVLESDQPYAQELWKGAAALGWLGTTIPEQYGGAGLGYLELAVIAEEVGRVLAPIPFGGSVYLATEALILAGSPEQKQRYLPRLAAGEIIGAFALAEGAGQTAADRVATRFDHGTLSGSKVPVLDGGVADFAVVVARGEQGISLALVDLDAEGVSVEPVTCFDPSRPQARLEFAEAPAQQLGEAVDGLALVERVIDGAAVLTAFEQLGGAARAFDITRQYLLERYAFGRPVASFQAIKHRLADLWCEIELARSNCYYGAWALSCGEAELGVAAAVARIAASDVFCKATQEMIQMHGGVGYTWEFDCHLFYRRAKLLAASLGSTSGWKRKLMDRLTQAAA